MQIEVNKANLIKSIIALLVFTSILIVSEVTEDQGLRAYLKGVITATAFLPVLGITKWTWDPPFKKVEPPK